MNKILSTLLAASVFSSAILHAADLPPLQSDTGGHWPGSGRQKKRGDHQRKVGSGKYGATLHEAIHSARVD